MKLNLLFSLLAFALVSLALGTTSCKKDQADETPFFSETELAELRVNTCMTLDADEPYAISDAPDDVAEDRATGAKNKFWSPGATLRVRFLNGTSTLQSKAFNYAKQWESYANIHFVRVYSGASDIRVAFDAEGNFSKLGTDALNVAATAKTMNLAFTSSSTEEQIRRASLHEFGHALGLNHEHQHPMADIPWNKPAAYAYYLQTNGWSAQQVDQQVFNKLSWESSQHTSFDSKSIMEYPVPANLTTNGFSIAWNTELSATDKEFIGKMYSSQRIRVRHSVNTTSVISFWLNGIYHTLKPGESLWVPAKTSGNQLYIWECVSGNCAWDGYAPPYGYNYKIVAQGSNGNLTLVYE